MLTIGTKKIKVRCKHCRNYVYDYYQDGSEDKTRPNFGKTSQWFPVSEDCGYDRPNILDHPVCPICSETWTTYVGEEYKNSGEIILYNKNK
jgi:hypothetical protein